MLKSIQKPTHLRNFAGQTLGVDAYGWLHRGTVSCAIELAEQKPTRKHIEFALSRVRMLLYFGVKPYLVFDGDYLPSKAHTEKERAARRKESKRLGLELLRTERISRAHLELQKAVDVTPLMARELIEELKRLDVPYIVAPYEADSQLAYLEQQGVISGILSEDSDLLVFGAKCLLTKLDQHGECVAINRADFTACRDISLVGWTDKEFRMMAMLSGCDYLPGIDKMGLKTAYRLVRKHKTIDRVVRIVQFDGKMKVPPGYLEAFAKAENTFLYQWVFCPKAKVMVNLNTAPTSIDVHELEYIGKQADPDVAAGVAAGNLDPNTKERLVLPPGARSSLTRSSTVQTPTEKQGKSIAEFFKAQRTPLAELDPNSFTPSPSQQRLLQSQSTALWSASPVVNVRPEPRLRTTSAALPSSAPHPVRRTVSTPYATASQASPKRQRLCSDVSIAASMHGTMGIPSATSRFFARPGPQASPSMRKASSQMKQGDFEVWSDEAPIDDAVACTSANDLSKSDTAALTPRKRKKLAIWIDPMPKEHGHETSQETYATTLSSKVTSQSSYTTIDSTFETSTMSRKTSIFSEGVNADFVSLKSRFAFTAAEGLAVPYAQAIKSPQERSQPRDVDLTKTHRGEARPKPQDRSTQPVDDALDGEIIVPNSSPLREEECNFAEAGERNVDVADPQESVDLRRHPPVWSALHGSEDLLVPRSPSEDGDDGRHRPKLDLRKFTFAS